MCISYIVAKHYICDNIPVFLKEKLSTKYFSSVLYVRVSVCMCVCVCMSKCSSREIWSVDILACLDGHGRIEFENKMKVELGEQYFRADFLLISGFELTLNLLSRKTKQNKQFIFCKLHPKHIRLWLILQPQ